MGVFKQSGRWIANGSFDRIASGGKQPVPVTKVVDIAYAHIRSCLVYAAAIIDLWSHEVVGYAGVIVE